MANSFEQTLTWLSRAAEVHPVPADLLARLSVPEREVAVSIPVTMDDGSVKLFEGYRVQYSSLLGPYKGGIRFHPDADSAEVRTLAFLMMLKCAVAQLPMGGGKGGVTVDPKQLSKQELQRLSRGWVKLLYPVLGPDRDVPAPDVNTTPEIIGWMADEYEKRTGDTRNAAFTGKPLENGGSEGRAQATGMGGLYTFAALRERASLPESVTIAVQGMGNVGGNAARLFYEHGHRVIAMSDSKGGIVSEKGLNPVEVETYKKTQGTLAGFPGAKEISNAELLELSCDVLVPAALENQITAANASRVKAKMILELANGPTAPEADDLLFARNIPVVPDILANAGGVIVSTLEWEQNLKNEHWSEAEVLSRLNAVLTREALHVWDTAKKLGTDLRRAAFVVALTRLEAALKNN
jgi:glutamate dehydrogenase